MSHVLCGYPCYGCYVSYRTEISKSDVPDNGKTENFQLFVGEGGRIWIRKDPEGFQSCEYLEGGY